MSVLDLQTLAVSTPADSKGFAVAPRSLKSRLAGSGHPAEVTEDKPEHRPLDVIEGLLNGARDAVKTAVKILLDELWRFCSFAVAPENIAVEQDITQLLNFARQFPLDFVDPLDHHELSMFQAIARADLASLGELANEFIKGDRRAAALLALDHFFSRLPELTSYKIHQMSSFLAKFLEYAQLLHSIISDPDPLAVDHIKRLFCLKEGSNTEYDLHPGSFLHSSTLSDGDAPSYSPDSAISLPKNDVIFSLRKYLAKHLRERVMEENVLCCGSPIFALCLTFTMTDCCNFAGCAKEHVKREELDPKRYNLRLGIHLQQIHILQIMFSVNPYPLVPSRAIMLDWLSYLYDALKPSSHVQGSIANLDLSPIPGALGGMRVMKYWVREALYKLRPGHRDYLTTVLRLTCLLFTFDRCNALDCINRAYFSRHSKIEQFIYPDGHWVVEDIVKIFDGTQFHCISAGSRFLSHIFKSLQVGDLSVFCDRIEEHISKISIASRLSSLFHPPLDGLVLPRAWLLANHDLSKKKSIWVGTTLESVKGLVMHLQSDSANPIYTLLDAKLTPALRHVFISRMALCFLMFNVVYRETQRGIKDIFSALRPAEPTQRAHPMYRKYVETTDYLKAALEYDDESKVVIQDVVQLLHKKRNILHGRPLQLPRVKEIYFADPSEIPSLLSARFVDALSELGLETPADIPQNTPQTGKAAGEQMAQAEEVDSEPMPKDDRALAEQISAVKIQVTYRQYRKRREARACAFGTGLEAKKNRVFAKCVKYIYASNWGKTPYRTLYLWALPRLVVCLDRAVEIAYDIKFETKRQLSVSENHECLEERGMRMSKICALLKNGHLLQKRIDPSASMHQPQNRDQAALKKAVLDVKDIIDNLPVSVPDIQDDFDFVYEYVVGERKRALELGRSEPNTEALRMYYWYY